MNDSNQHGIEPNEMAPAGERGRATLPAHEALETEIKLAATPAMLEALRDHPLLAGSDRVSALVTTYFDTPDRRLSHAGASLRLREDSKQREQTVKLPAQTGLVVVRGEWTVPAGGPLPDIGAFGAEPREAIERLLGGEGVVPVAETRVERTVRQIAHGTATLELAYDRGTIQAGGCKEPVCELEIELVAGSLADLLDLARMLPLGPDLQWSLASKSGRCLALADGTAPAAAHAHPSGVTRAMDGAEGFHAIAWTCLSHLLENVPLVVERSDPEALHQSRVAIRRLRTTLGLFGPLFEDDGQAAALGAQFKAVANAMGPARGAHVLLERLTAAAAAEGQDAAELLALARASAARDMVVAQALVAGAGFQTLLFDFALWVERGAWLNLARADPRPLPHFAARALRKRRRKFRRLDDDPTAMTNEERHGLRIAVKKWRYSADFLAPLYSAKGARKAQRRFKALAARVQAHLGDLHDLDGLAADCDALCAGLEPIERTRIAAQLSALMPSLAASHHTLLSRVARAAAKLDQAEPWWTADL